MRSILRKLFFFTLVTLFVSLLYCEFTHTTPVKHPDSVDTK